MLKLLCRIDKPKKREEQKDNTQISGKRACRFHYNYDFCAS